MWFDFISEIKKSLAAKIITTFVLLLFIFSFVTASFFIYDKSKQEKSEIIHGSLMLVEIVVLLSKSGLIEESREKLENDLEGLFWDKDIIKKVFSPIDYYI